MAAFLSEEIIARRVFNTLYIYLDIVFLVGLLALLIVKRKYLTLLFGLFGGVLYMVVDYGIFHLALHTRQIEGGNLFAVLLWMSMSYGITNFVWMWIWMSRDEHKFYYTGLICIWWLCAPMLAQTFGSKMPTVAIQRTTGSYHGYMALILLIGYAAAIVFNLFQKDKSKRFPILWLFVIGVAVQFGWEFSLLIGGIRSAGFTSAAQKIQTLVVNSLLETNLGAVPIYCIYLLVTSRFTETLGKRDKVSFLSRMRELNGIPLFPRAARPSAADSAKSAVGDAQTSDNDGGVVGGGGNEE